MKKTCLALPFLALMPLSANSWELGAFVGQQSLKSGQTIAAGGSSSYDPDTKTVFGLRVGRSLVDFGPVLLEVTAGFQPEATHIVKGTHSTLVPLTGSFTTSTLSQDYKTSHYSAGAMFILRSFVSVGAGIEYRFEKLELGGVSTNYARPWGRVNVGISFPTPLLKPFIGLEAAAPMASKSMGIGDSAEDTVKALGPKLQLGVYGGIRF